VKDRPGGIDGLKNWSGKCEGLAGGRLNGLKNRSEKCEGPAGGLDGLKNRSGKCEGLVGGGGDQRFFENKIFFRKPKTSTKRC
jgi:hypothetical protein